MVLIGRVNPLPSFLAVITLAVSATAAEPLAIATDFPGGSAEVVAIDAATRSLHIRPALHSGRGWPCWWYFRVDGAEAGKELSVVVSGNPGPFRPGGAALAANWAQPTRASISIDDRNWTQTPEAAIDAAKKTATYRFTTPAGRFWLAWGPPFLPAHADELLKQTAAKISGAELFTLAKTKRGRPVNGIRLGNRDAPAAIWVQARQHAWEAGGSWVGRGFLDWVASDDPAAKFLRDRCDIHFVPIMDVDNVTDGAGGKEAVPRDHNRDWSDAPNYPEVAAAQAKIAALDQSGRLRFFIDLHNPGPGEKQPYFFGPFDYEALTGRSRENYTRWITIAGEEMAGKLPLLKAYKFATYVTSEEERGRMSTGWVRAHTDPERVVSVTLETAWNAPQSHAEGYRDTGARLGRSVARFFQP